MDKFGRIECLFEDWDDTTLPRPVCHCLKRGGVDCASVPDDVISCSDYKKKYPDKKQIKLGANYENRKSY